MSNFKGKPNDYYSESSINIINKIIFRLQIFYYTNYNKEFKEYDNEMKNLPHEIFDNDGERIYSKKELFFGRIIRYTVNKNKKK